MEMLGLTCYYNSSAPDEVRRAQIDAILSALPRCQRRPIEDYFGFVSEASIAEEIKMMVENHGYQTVAELEESLKGTGLDARALAIAELSGH